MRALTNFKRLLQVRRVDRMRAVATSAVREARNRDRVHRRIQRETGLTVEVISGLEEAQLIFRLRAMRSASRADLICWSTSAAAASNWCWCATAQALWMQSVKLGAARLTERFLARRSADARSA